MSSTTLRRKDKYARYMWLIDTIRRHDRCMLQEIDRRWRQEETLNPDGAPLSRRTFQQHKEAINAMDFGVEIVCTGNRYYSVCLDDHNPLGVWMWQTLSLRLMLAESRTLNERIITEEIPSADRWLHPILSALRENRRLQITYRLFGKDLFEKEEFTLLLSPYFVQMSDRRWYVFGLREDETSLKAYALDRILACEPSEETFTPPETFSAGECLQQHGIGQYEAIPETEIVVRAYKLRPTVCARCHSIRASRRRKPTWNGRNSPSRCVQRAALSASCLPAESTSRCCRLVGYSNG